MSATRSMFEKMRRGRLIALLAPESAGQCLAAYDVLDPLGVVLEIALRSDSALAGIAALRRERPGALVLAGTVMTREQARAALEAGAAGVVSADYIPAVVEECVRRDVMCVPGGLADAGKQLVQKAELYGCSLAELREKHPHQWLYKLFPAVAGAAVNLGMAQAWRAVYRDLVVIYTGGVTADNLERVARADPQGIICASALAAHAADPERMRREARVWLAVLRGEEAGRAASPRPAAAPQQQAQQAGAVVAFGEIMLRLSPPHGTRLRQAAALDARFGGAEANVAASLAQFGRPARFVSALPANDLGQAALDRLRSLGVDTGHVVRRGKRIGIYFLEHGAAQRPSRVLYDRAGSSLAEIGAGDIDWPEVFRGARWFHWSGITPALSPGCAAALQEALCAAKAAGLTVSADLNYRSRLWTREQARAVMAPLMEHVDLAVGNESDAADVFGISAAGSDAEAGRIDAAGYRDVARRLAERCGVERVAITLRESLSASDNDWSACLYHGGNFLQSRKHRVHVVDRVGAGDAFCAGLIHALLDGKEDAAALEFAVAAACLKHTVEGDFNCASVAEVEALAGGQAAGRVVR
ncbi:MAG: hypothetical protein HY812_21005 [Planctomycetes bacterium]|nr:hypothetical protein [Planctomycetota bacterium]